MNYPGSCTQSPPKRRLPQGLFLVLRGHILDRQNMAGIFLFTIFPVFGIVAGRLLSASLAGRRLRALYAILYQNKGEKANALTHITLLY